MPEKSVDELRFEVALAAAEEARAQADQALRCSRHAAIMAMISLGAALAFGFWYLR